MKKSIAAVNPAALKVARRAAHVTLWRAAQFLHTTPELLAQLESGEDAPSLRQVGILARVYGLPVENLTGA